MKKNKLLLCIITGLLFCLPALSQVPEGISYQSVVRDAENALVKYGMLKVQISILAGGENGTCIYRETHNVPTNENGLMSLLIGQGNVSLGTFSTIDWSSDNYFIKTEVALDGNNYTISTVTQLLSVPYALHAKSADNIKGTISFNSLTDVPAGFDFSGDYNDLTGKPAIADSIKTYGFSGNYDDLANKPTLGDNGFTGSYFDLSNKPNFADSITRHGFNGDYTNLTNVPDLFSGDYQELLNKPSLKDSIIQYSFSGNYPDLSNLPNIKDSIARYGGSDFNGDYSSLINRPVFRDSINQYGFSGNYHELTNRPNITDSIQQHAFNGNYNELAFKPNIKDSIARYGFSGSYNDLNYRPNISDSIAEFGFSGNYHDLSYRPNIADSIAEFGFSGEFNDLKGKPEGNTEGDMLYWQDGAWVNLQKGRDGEILIVQNGELTWLHAAYVFRNLTTTTFDTIVVDGYPLANGKITDENNLIRNGLLEVPRGFDVAFLITPDEDYGVYSLLINGKDSTIMERDRNGIVYFTFENVSKKDTISAVFESRMITTSVKYDEGGSITPSGSVPIGYMRSKTFTFTPEEGYGIDSVMLGSKDITAEIIANKFTIENATTDSTLTVKFASGVFSVGEIYYEDTNPVGIIFEVSNRGKNAKILSLTENESLMAWSENSFTSYCSSLGQGWRMPEIEELETIAHAKSQLDIKIESTSGAQAIDTSTGYWSKTVYTESEDYAYSYSFGIEAPSAIEKQAELRVRAIKEISKE